jgi:hypothetical protein
MRGLQIELAVLEELARRCGEERGRCEADRQAGPAADPQAHAARSSDTGLAQLACSLPAPQDPQRHKHRGRLP